MVLQQEIQVLECIQYVLKETKGYHYIPDLQKAILAKRLGSGMGLPRRQSKAC